MDQSTATSPQFEQYQPEQAPPARETLTAIAVRVGATIPRHEYSALFGDMEQEQFDAMCEGIQKAGALGSEIILYDGKVLDGYHRYIACLSVGVTPNIFTLAEYAKSYGMTETPDPLDFATGRNRDRRHLTHEQLLALGRNLKKKFAERAALRMQSGVKVTDGEKGSSADLASKATGGAVSADEIDRADQFAREHPDLDEKVEAGEITRKQARSVAKARPTASSKAKPPKLEVVDSEELKAEKAQKLVEALAAAKAKDMGNMLSLLDSAERELEDHDEGDEEVVVWTRKPDCLDTDYAERPTITRTWAVMVANDSNYYGNVRGAVMMESQKASINVWRSGHRKCEIREGGRVGVTATELREIADAVDAKLLEIETKPRESIAA